MSPGKVHAAVRVGVAVVVVPAAAVLIAIDVAAATARPEVVASRVLGGLRCAIMVACK